MQSRKDKVVRIFLICLIIYIACLLLLKRNQIFYDYMLTLPGYMLMTYGCYCLISIGKSTEKITEKETEFIQLQQEIIEAKKFVEANNLN